VLVDRAFFGSPYEGSRILAKTGAALVTALTREHIARLLKTAVEEAIPNAQTRIFLERPTDGLREVSDDGPLPPPLATLLAAGRVVTSVDLPETYPKAVSREAVVAALARLGAEVAVPIRVGEELAGVLTAGRRHSGRYYTAGDADFLVALAQQAAIALQNARSYESLVALNSHLEERVRERTDQLEQANREMVDAYATLKRTEVQLVQAEKMAALGQLVAGVAHEINNPVSFVLGNVAPLRERLERLRALAEAHQDGELSTLADRIARAFEIIARGAERTAAIVGDLRTFSRVGDAHRHPMDVQESIEMTLRLLRPRWAGRIAIHRDYGSLPPIEAVAGHINQVLMNLLANACDAIPGRGNIWVRTRAGGTTVSVSIRDDGIGITAEHVHRIFEPFFTTKPLGEGTGLGLAITHGIVASHGGRIEVASQPGRGTEFSLVLPVDPGVTDTRGERTTTILSAS
jgi:signal transduction histidine kinase